MAQSGQTINNPVTGEHITFVLTSDDTNGERLVFDCRVEPGKPSLPAHVHTSQEERFTMVSGTLGVLLGKEIFTLRPGNRITLPAGIKHQWWNAGKDDAEFRVEVVPPRNLETVLEAVCGMAQAGKINRRVMPRNPFLLASFGLLSETYLPGIPVVLQRVGLRMGALTARMLGYSADFAEYRTTPAPTASEAALEQLPA